MGGMIYIAGALIFGIGYAFLKPHLEAPWLIVIAVAYFALLRLLGQYADRYSLRRAISRAEGKRK